MLAVAASGCAPEMEDSTAERAKILQRFQQGIDEFSAAENPEEAADIYLEMHTPDAVLLVPGAPPIQGREAIRPFIVEFAEAYEFHFPSWESHEVFVSGGLAVHRFSGVAAMTPRNGGEEVREFRSYMDIWKRGEDGRWRIARHMYNVRG